MLISYAQAAQADLPKHTQQFVRAAMATNAPTGMILLPQALYAYMDESGTGQEVSALIRAVTDEESRKRVDAEIKRRVRTGRIPEQVAAALTEANDVLGLEEKDMAVHPVPLVVLLSTDEPMTQEAVIINVVGTKALADAVRNVWSKLYMSPFPDENPQASVIIYRMPPAEVTAHVAVSGQITIDGVQGWGRFVQTPETGDVFQVDAQTSQILSRDIQTQESMIYRNPRSGQVVQTKPHDPSGQKITEPQIQTLAREAKKTGVTEAVFGVTGDSCWLLSTRGYTVGLPPSVAMHVEEAAQQEPEAIEETYEAPSTEEPMVDVQEEYQEPQEEQVQQYEQQPEVAEPQYESPQEEQEIVEESQEQYEVPQETPEYRDEEVTQEELEENDYEESEDGEYDPETEEEYDETQEGEAYEDEDSEAEDAEYEDTEEVEYEDDDEQAEQEYESEDEADEYEEPEDGEEYESEDGDEEYLESDDGEEEYQEGDEEYDSEDEPQEGEEYEDDDEDDEDEPETAQEAVEFARDYASEAVNNAFIAIELTLREWLHESDQIEDFGELVNAVAAKRTLPYKQRLLALFEMEKQDVFEDPKPEDVRFALETMQRFVSEF